jgi:hypothetical protein
MPLTNAEGIKRDNLDGLGCDWCGRIPEPEACQSASGKTWIWDQLVADRGERVCQPCRRDYDEMVARTTEQMPVIVQAARYRSAERRSFTYGICECGGQIAGHPRDDHWAAAYDHLKRS